MEIASIRLYFILQGGYIHESVLRIFAFRKM